MPRGRGLAGCAPGGRGFDTESRHVNTPRAQPKKHSGLNVASSVICLRPVVKQGSKNTEREIGGIPRVTARNHQLLLCARKLVTATDPNR
jgi:hypothetical protein